MSSATTKERYVVSNYYVGVDRLYYDGQLLNTAYWPSYDVMIQRTTSQGNPFGRKNRLHKKFVQIYGYDPTGNQDIGGYFLTQKVTTTTSPSWPLSMDGKTGGLINWHYDGRQVAWTMTPSLTANDFVPPSTPDVLDSYGTTAIARCIPTNPLAGMGQFLGELRDLPKIPALRAWKSRARNLRNGAKRINFDKLSREAAGEYLNQVFGWVPFVNDLQKFAKTAADAGPQMEKFAKGANQLLHRSYYFPDEVSNQVEILSQGSVPSPALSSYYYAKTGVLTRTTSTITKRWFKGAFTYHLPPLDPNDNGFVKAINKFKFAEASANRLFGLRLNPDVLWKIAPWSWAVDWVSNAGDVVHNWSSFASDGLVMDYGYIMEHITKTVTYSLVGCRTSAGDQTFTQTWTYETKSRKRATPYGFGVNPASFSAKQWSIIAALGISKQPLSLNF